MSKNQKGCLITFEGIEGSGKSTVLQHIQDWLQGRGQQVNVVREPGGTPLAEEVRSLVLCPREERVDDMTELLLIFAARAQLLAERVRPALARGEWVLCDRFTDSTYAYQGAGRQLGEEPVAKLETMVQGALRPDLCLLLDAPIADAIPRAVHADRIGAEKQDFMERVRSCYLERARQQPKRYRVVDASQPLAQVLHSVEEALRPCLERSA